MTAMQEARDVAEGWIRVPLAQGAATHIGQPMIRVVERQKGVASRESHGDQELSRATKSTPLLPPKKLRGPGAFCNFALPRRRCHPERALTPMHALARIGVTLRFLVAAVIPSERLPQCTLLRAL